ncbi:MAG TPA: transposase [Clostridiales bacterium]|nr:transposase [Clostridiales bacterium]
MPKGIPNKRYTPEFKVMVVEAMRKEGLSSRETARLYDVSSHHQVQNWERIYLTEGAKGLAVERRGRACAASGTKKGRPAKLPSKVEEDLLAENQRLRAENAYLKNLQALVLEDERHQRKKRR